MSKNQERASERLDCESSNIKQEAQGSKGRIEQRPAERSDKVRRAWAPWSRPGSSEDASLVTTG
jgi:hypothetical protein